MFDDGAVAKLWEYLDGVKNDITKEEQASSDAVAAAATTKTPAKQSAEGSEKKGNGVSTWRLEKGNHCRYS